MSNDINQDVAKELVAQTAGKTYDDIAHPTAHATGQIISFIPRTIKVWLGKWEKWILNGEYAIKETELLLAEKLKRIPEEKIVEPEPYVAIPAIQQLSYSLDSEELRELYANLLSSSMNADRKGDVHPAFVDIIKQITPDEAKLLKVLPLGLSNIPLIDLQIKLGQQRGSIIVFSNFTNIGDSVCQEPQNISAYIENLDRLKLISIQEDTHLVNDSLYTPLRTAPLIEKQKTFMLSGEQTYDFKKKSFRVTSFGELFINICVK